MEDVTDNHLQSRTTWRTPVRWSEVRFGWLGGIYIRCPVSSLQLNGEMIFPVMYGSQTIQHPIIPECIVPTTYLSLNHTRSNILDILTYLDRSVVLLSTFPCYEHDHDREVCNLIEVVWSSRIEPGPTCADWLWMPGCSCLEIDKNSSSASSNGSGRSYKGSSDKRRKLRMIPMDPLCWITGLNPYKDGMTCNHLQLPARRRKKNPPHTTSKGIGTVYTWGAGRYLIQSSEGEGDNIRKPTSTQNDKKTNIWWIHTELERKT